MAERYLEFVVRGEAAKLAKAIIDDIMPCFDRAEMKICTKQRDHTNVYWMGNKNCCCCFDDTML